MEAQPPISSRDPTLVACREVAAVFLKIGLAGFGGPAAHIALMEDEVVRRRGWLSRQEFLDLVGAVNLIPGPNSTELSIHIGYRRAGWPGLVLAGTCFALPAIVSVLALAWLYVRFGALPITGGILRGVKPVIVAVIAQALWRLGRRAVKSWFLGIVGAASVAVGFLGLNELLVLFGAALVVGLGESVQRFVRCRRHPTVLAVGLLPGWSMVGLGSAAGGAVSAVGLWPLFAFFAKVGCVWFGSGYVLLAFLQADLVERWRWMTESQLLDAIAIGQVTPGPLFTTATFIGFVLHGFPGAMVATAGIFLPALTFVAASAPFIPRLRRSRVAASLLDGLNVGALALMIVVTWYLGRAALVDWRAILLTAVSALLLIRFHVSSTWIILGGAVVGVICF